MVKDTELKEGTIVMGSAVVVTLPETVSARSARVIGRQLETEVEHGTPFVVLDLSRVKSMSLSAMETLLRCMNDVARKDGGLQVSGLSPEAATFLELTRMDKLMQKFPGFSIEAPAFELAPESIPAEEAAEPVQLQVAA